MPIGAATATRLRCIPRKQKESPSVRRSRAMVVPKDSCVGREREARARGR